MKHHLTLPQSLFLLARDDVTGKPIGSFNAYIQTAGALAELVMMDRLALRPGRKGILDVIDTAPTGSAYLDMLLARIGASSRPRTMQHWVNKFYCIRQRERTIGEELAAKGIVEETPAKILGVFPVTRWVQRKSGPKLKLTSDMSKILFQDIENPNERIGSIVALANAGHLLKRNFDREKLRAHKAHIKRIVKGDWPSAQAASKVIAATQAAIVASTIAVSASAG